MAVKLARMPHDDTKAQAAVASKATAAVARTRGNLDPLILALTRAVDRQTPDRSPVPESNRRG